MLDISAIKTEIGNQILADLVASGWRIEFEYPEGMIDKGIDYDAYILSKADARIECRWDNWDEWQIRGSTAAVQAICSQFRLTPDALAGPAHAAPTNAGTDAPTALPAHFP